MKIATSTERINELFNSDARSDSSIARALGVSRQSVSSWRSGARSPKKPMLIKIAEMYHVTIEWLMGFDVDRNVIISDSKLFRKIIMNMEPNDYRTVMEIFERTELNMRKKGLM